MKNLILAFFILFCKSVFACDCTITGLLDRFERADFVATAEIKKITPAGNDYHDIEIKISEVFKGSVVSKLKIKSILNSSCAFYTPEKSNWLIFAFRNDEKELVFGSCSGAIQLDRKMNEERYPGLTKKFELSNQRKINVLRFIKENEINIKNDFRLKYTFLNDCLDNGKGFDLEEGAFGIFKIKVNKKLVVQKVTSIKGFQNETLNGIVIQCFREGFELYNNNQVRIPKSSEITVGIYYYGAEGKYRSFVTTHDL
ncbi:hypothetical protein [Zeaxanthinibacter enoshimensis]|uniref:Tissue inhibitor of metalloproteinase n=1 Tax=Zeaxanthinibacter enoshimensis TaxID=392009 RepID=A0A4R6TL66_9FLAO|nr:hypothetical protein [Zeaxanthinibacter enoshimensis]TDQ32182.1 hypothetical protein CLV82_0005 [Zeaxanthinibacter enoshimensis]